MNTTNLKRVTRLGLINFYRNLWLSLGAVLVLMLTLITITISLVQNIDIHRTIDSIKDKLDLTAYFDDKMSETEIQDLQLKLQSRSDIKSVAYISKDDALKIWASRPTSGQVKDLVTLESNPLPRSLVIKTDEPESLAKIAALLEAPTLKDKVRRVSYQDNKKIIQDLIDKNNLIRQNGLISSLTFALISLVVIINTIRIMILTRKEEIEIMRLVGAPELFIRGPFIVEAVVAGFCAALLATSFLVAGVVFDIPIVPFFVSRYFGDISNTIRDLILGHIILIFSLQLATAFILTTLTTFFSLRRQIRS